MQTLAQYEAVKSQVMGHYQAQFEAGGKTATALSDVITRAVATLLKELAEVVGLDPAKRREMIIAAAGELFDTLAPFVDIPFVPEFVETRFIDPALRPLVLAAVEGAYDALLSVFDKAGWLPDGDGRKPLMAAAVVADGVVCF